MESMNCREEGNSHHPRARTDCMPLGIGGGAFYGFSCRHEYLSCLRLGFYWQKPRCCQPNCTFQ
jgi:hypothetical protein